MRNALPCAIFATALLTGCESTQTAGSLFYLPPLKLEELTCRELRQRIADTSARVNSLQELRDRADRSAAGPVVNTVVYGPDYSKARWELQAYEQELARKNCEAAPLPPPSATASTQAAQPQPPAPPFNPLAGPAGGGRRR
jgi:hypothetical protein